MSGRSEHDDILGRLLSFVFVVELVITIIGMITTSLFGRVFLEDFVRFDDAFQHLLKFRVSNEFRGLIDYISHLFQRAIFDDWFEHQVKGAF